MPALTKAFDGIITYSTVIIVPSVIHFVIRVTGTTAIGSHVGRAWLLLIGLMADKWFRENDTASYQTEKGGGGIEIES